MIDLGKALKIVIFCIQIYILGISFHAFHNKNCEKLVYSKLLLTSFKKLVYSNLLSTSFKKFYSNFFFFKSRDMSISFVTLCVKHLVFRDEMIRTLWTCINTIVSFV